MILSFSVPDNPKYKSIIDWYKSQDPQERSREFRNIFLPLLKNTYQVTENFTVSHISHNTEIKRIELVSSGEEDDLESKINLIGIRR